MKKENWTDYLQIGLELSVSVLAFLAAGYFLDFKLGTKPFLTLGGAFLGISSVFYLLWKRFLRGGKP
ncbi:MAG: hypothetical protein COT17_06570 [Elusimicrobia bacterium CG08_land_8_20_14_0_20_51_18]|nr:MAG: hypothetical protein COT17_06570 [Elusimicrobia bacterium CG08_land_8_20_14_0_20_51_18]